MPRVVLGNPLPIFNGRVVSDPTAMTAVDIPDCKSLADAVRDIAHDDGAHSGLWVSHSAAPAPTWVSCDASPELEAAIAERFGCPAGRPTE